MLLIQDRFCMIVKKIQNPQGWKMPSERYSAKKYRQLEKETKHHEFSLYFDAGQKSLNISVGSRKELADREGYNAALLIKFLDIPFQIFSIQCGYIAADGTKSF